MGNDAKETITVSKETLWKFTAFTMLGLLVASVFTGGFGVRGNDSGAATGAAVAPAPSGAQAPQRPSAPPSPSVDAEALVDDDPYLGDDNAPVTIVEFSDFQCPFCRRFWDQTLPQLKSEYIDTGKVKFVYRDFPLTSIHPGAEPAAQAAECAEDQGKFWEMHDKIFEEQNKQGGGTVQFGVAELKQWASGIGLDAGQFNDCLDSGKYSAEVQKDLSDATASGGRGTPYFVVGSSPVSGAQPFSAFQAVIEAELAKGG